MHFSDSFIEMADRYLGMKSDRLPTCEVCGSPCPNAHIDIRKPGPNGSSIRHDLCDKHWQTNTASVDLDFSYRVSA